VDATDANVAGGAAAMPRWRAHSSPGALPGLCR
jgi:hypothetical protein